MNSLAILNSDLASRLMYGCRRTSGDHLPRDRA